MNSHEFWMGKALRLAQKAGARGEVPVGALIIRNDELVAKASNRREQWHSPLGHAELIALQRASQSLKAWRLLGCTLYVTLEPCVMCAGALVQARVDRVIYGAPDPKGGGLKSLYQIGTDPRLNHRFELMGGILEQQCSQVLKDFFRMRRQKE